jgi:hypothetical protein
MPLDTERDFDFDALMEKDDVPGASDRYEWTLTRGSDDECDPVDFLRHFPAEKTDDGYRVVFPAGFCRDCLTRTMIDECSGAVAWLCEHQSLIVALDMRQGEVAYLPWLLGRDKFERAFSLAAAEAEAIYAVVSDTISRKLH